MKRSRAMGRLGSIALAGGEGERLRPFVQQWLGHLTGCCLLGITGASFQGPRVPVISKTL
jgi:hypothetical protein